MMFVVKNLTFARVNLIMNDFVAGMPSPLSFVGYADAIARKVGIEPWSASVLPVLHSVSSPEGRTKPEMEAKSGIFKPIETLEDLTGLVTCSLLIDLPGFNNETDLRHIISNMRFAGGLLQNAEISSNQVKMITSDGSAFRQIYRGFALLRPRNAENLIISNGDENTLSSVIAKAFPAERMPGSGWLIPAAVGHHMIEDPDTVPFRSGKRDTTIPHVFTEPLIGLVEMASVRNPDFTKVVEDDLLDLFWNWHAEGEYVVGHKNYHPKISTQLKAS